MSDQRLIKPLDQNVLGKVQSDEHHLAGPGFAFGPGGSEIAAHQLMHALEDHLAVGAFHVQHPFVAQHARAVHLHDGAKEVFELGRVERPRGPVDKALHIVIVVVMVPVGAVAMLGIFCTGLVYFLYMALIQKAGPTFASFSNYLVPLFQGLLLPMGLFPVVFGDGIFAVLADSILDRTIRLIYIE